LKKNKNIKHKIEKTKILVITLIISLLVILGMITLWFNKSSKWDNLKFDTKLADISPEFASDNRSLDLEEDIKEFKKLEDELDNIKKKDKLSKDVNEVLEVNKQLIDKYKLKEGSIVENKNKIEMYINYYNFKQTAYDNIDPERLEKLNEDITKEIIEHNDPFDIKLANNLNSIIKDYNNLFDLIRNLNNYGVTQNNVLKVYKDIFGYDTLQFDQLMAFPYIQELQRKFRNTDVFDNNRILQEQELWENQKQKLKNFNKNNYVKVKDLKTIKDLNQNNIQYKIVDYREKEDNELDETSEIIKIKYNDKLLHGSEYVKKYSTELTISIIPKYKDKKKDEEERNKDKDSNENRDNQRNNERNNNRRQTDEINSAARERILEEWKKNRNNN
jgi:hypothetical protein